MIPDNYITAAHARVARKRYTSEVVFAMITRNAEEGRRRLAVFADCVSEETLALLAEGGYTMHRSGFNNEALIIEW